MDKFRIIVAPFTPLAPGGSLDLAVVAGLANWYRRNTLDGVFICGTTGEGPSLSVEERKRLAEAWMKVKGDMQVIVHVGHNSLEEAKALARHAASIGADGISSVGPSYYQPAGPEALVAWCGALAGAAPSIPFYYYHIPSITGIRFRMSECLSRFEQIGSFAGIKYTHEDLYDLGRCIDRSGDSNIFFFGRDEILLSGLVLGARSAVGSFYNYLGKHFRALIDAFDAGELGKAAQLQEWVRAFCKVYYDHGASIATGKAIMRIVGLDCGPPRLPLSPLTKEQEDRLGEDLRSIGFTDKILS